MNVAVLGAGYAGVTLARRLERSLPDDVELLVVDEADEHLVRHELHRIIRRPEVAADLRVPLSSIFDRARIRQARVAQVDPESNRVVLDGGEELTYDYGAVCLGSETAFHDLPGIEEHATPLKRLEDATRIRNEFLTLLDQGGGTVAVGGGGLSGIQVTGELADLAKEEGARESLELVLLEQLDDIAPEFPANFQGAVREELESRDVIIKTGTTVTGASSDRIELDAGGLDYDQFIWTGGIRGPAAISGQRRRVRGTLRLGNGTFVVGDAAQVVDRDGELVPATAQAAIREARVAAKNIRRLVEYDRNGGIFEPRLDALDFTPRGWVVSVGESAVAQFGPTVLRGASARALKRTIGLSYLTSVGAVREALEVAIEGFGD